MGRLFCLSVFGRKNKAAKDMLYTDMAQKTQVLSGQRDCVVHLPEHFLNAGLPVESTVYNSAPNEARQCVNAEKCGTMTNGPTNNKNMLIAEFTILDERIRDGEFSMKGDLQNSESITDPKHIVILIKDEPYEEGNNIVKADRVPCQEDKPSCEKPLDHLSTQLFAENVSGKDGDSNVDEGIFHSKKSGNYSIGDCSDESDTEFSDSCRMEPPDSVRSIGVENMSPTRYYATKTKRAFQEHCRAEIIISGSYDCEASNDKASLFIGRTQCDDLLSGHVSDPGVYQREEVQSLNGSPVLHGGGSPSCVIVEGSVSSNNHDAYSNISKSVPSADPTENLSMRTNEQYPGPITDRMESFHPLPCEIHVSGSAKNSWKDDEAFNQELCQKFIDSADNVEHYTIIVDDNANEAGGFDEKGGVIISDIQKAPVSDFENCFMRVEQWINAIDQSELSYEEEAVPAFGATEEVVDMSNIQSNPAPADADIASASLRTLNAFTTVAHFNGIGLRDVPSVGHYNCLKTLNLSGNLITRVPAGCLPQNLHELDLSRNRISQIEGFRDLTRLRTLDLSYNRISKIGHGLANCTLIKELYLAGNKIAEVEGLHRLLKLSVLDLSHNKIATSKGLGQLAANYSSLLALNLVGNPILTNIGDDQVRKLVTSLTPHVTYLNKQAIKAVSVRDSVVDTVAKAALGNSRNRSSTSNRSRTAGSQSSLKKPPASHWIKDGERRHGTSRTSKHHHHHHRNILNSQNDNKLTKMDANSVTLQQRLPFETGVHPMHRSKSDSLLQEDLI